MRLDGTGSATNNSGKTSVVAYNLMTAGNARHLQGPANSPYLNKYTGYAVLESSGLGQTIPGASVLRQ